MDHEAAAEVRGKVAKDEMPSRKLSGIGLRRVVAVESHAHPHGRIESVRVFRGDDSAQLRVELVVVAADDERDPLDNATKSKTLSHDRATKHP